MKNKLKQHLLFLLGIASLFGLYFISVNATKLAVNEELNSESGFSFLDMEEGCYFTEGSPINELFVGTSNRPRFSVGSMKSSCGKKRGKGSTDLSKYDGSKCGPNYKENACQMQQLLYDNFEDIPEIGGYRECDQYMEHCSGAALDIMVAPIGTQTKESLALGDEIADFLIENAEEFEVVHLIWKQRVWINGQGWSNMEGRGSITQDHFDHVHLCLKGCPLK